MARATLTINALAERRIKAKAKPVITLYLAGEIDFDVLMNTLQGIDDAAEYEMAAAEEVQD